MTPMRRILSFRDFDWPMLAMVLALCTISVLEIYSATLHTKYTGFHTKQIFWIAAGLVAMFLFSKIDYHRLLDWVPWAYGVCMVALLAVLAVGQKVLGARRWIKLGPMHFQPSEWVKLVLILAVARYFANLGGRSLTWKDIFKAFALVGVPLLLVLKQPDLGTALTYTPILVAGLFLGGINLRQALILSVCGTALIAGVAVAGAGEGTGAGLQFFAAQAEGALQFDIFVEGQALAGDLHVAHFVWEMKHFEGVGAGGAGDGLGIGESGRAVPALVQRRDAAATLGCRLRIVAGPSRP